MIVERKGRILDFTERVEPAKTALIVIDVQNDFCDPVGAFGRLGHDLSMMPVMAGNLRDLIGDARTLGVLTIFVRATYDEVVLSRPLAENYHRRGFTDSMCLDGTWGADWYGDVRPSGGSNEIVLTKHRYSPFWGTAIDLYLRSNGIGTVILTGVVTSGCVDSTARDAFFNDYFVVLASDCVAEASAERHEASLRKLGQSFGVVVPSAEIRGIWAGRQRPAQPWELAQKDARTLRDLAALVDPRHTALVLIDVQNDFCNPSGVMGGKGEDLEFIQSTLPAMANLLAVARRAGATVVHVRAEYGPLSDSEVMRAKSADAGGDGCCVPGTWGSAFIDGFEPTPGEPVVVKHRFSGFIDTQLDSLLRSNGIRTVVMVGVATHCCVESTARDASMRDYYVVIPEDGVAVRGRMRHLHETSLETMRMYFATVTPSKTVIDVWSRRIA
ncbi:MAG TPA: isochorismatase family protein [Candidatus Methylomirabilis sp.]|nr:isochorismatase family protein [Candidatus Methylomirabilis sp.]